MSGTDGRDLAALPKGRLITETLEFDGGRKVTAYVPPHPPEAIVFAGDGQLIAPWGSVLEAAYLPPTMIVGAHRLDDETLRLHEYSPGESTAAFAFDASRRVESWRSPWASAIPTSTARCSARRRAPTTGYAGGERIESTRERFGTA